MWTEKACDVDGKPAEEFTEMTFMRTLSLLLALTLAASGQSVTYVDASATGAGDGSSWADAFTTLTLACSQTFSGEIWVAAGSYRNNDFGFRQTSILPKNGVEIYGGFSGTETQRDERDPAANVTILDGDLNGDDVFYLGNLNDNSHHIVTVINLQSCLFDGFTFRGGYTSGSSSTVGAAIRAVSSKLTVRNCIFRENVAKFGASIGAEGASEVTVENCEFSFNEARYGRGAGIHIGSGATGLVRKSRFVENRVTGGTVIGTGGAINSDDGSQLTVETCFFEHNTAVFGCCGGITASEGAAIRSRGSNTVITACSFFDNEAHDGGAVALSGSGVMENCLFSGNLAAVELGYGGFGGAILIRGASSSWTIRGCTVSKNLAIFGAGGVFSDSASASVVVEDSILWGNSDLRGTVGIAQIENVSAHHSCIQNYLVGPTGGPAPNPSQFFACIDSDPQFRDANGLDNIFGTPDDDLLLQPTSPCIDAGTPSNATEGFDLEGGLRRLDGDFNTLREVDMGACEFRPAELSVSRTIQPDGDSLFVADIVATDLFPVFLSIGFPRNTVQVIEPYGVWYVDWNQVHVFELVGYGSVSPSLELPASFPQLTAVFQAIAFTGPGTGTFTRPVTLQVP
jgi:parallel beta helix pectate lyase-like protein